MQLGSFQIPACLFSCSVPAHFPPASLAWSQPGHHKHFPAHGIPLPPLRSPLQELRLPTNSGDKGSGVASTRVGGSFVITAPGDSDPVVFSGWATYGPYSAVQHRRGDLPLLEGEEWELDCSWVGVLMPYSQCSLSPILPVKGTGLWNAGV